MEKSRRTKRWTLNRRQRVFKWMIDRGGPVIANVLPLKAFMSDTSKRKQESRVTYGSEVDWTEVQRVERDICLLYHQLADYSYIMGDLCYGDVFSLPYWEYLQIEELESDQAVSFATDAWSCSTPWHSMF
ncbi:hypothetical protein RISK_005049 [Rhodopirellula islandica]|uniref:Uncharacterized protein n=2 Tax=Rhodopirellula islandica TaxID=595434 RepID=A0A0J1B854_RHOIS|nr:hypothetical protein RISK_005049 [Rhodopirellula islandica]